MSKNARWALAIVGVAVLIIAAVVIGTGRDNTDATPVQGGGGESTGRAGPTTSTGSSTGATSAPDTPTSSDDSGGAGPGDSAPSTPDNSGGASPQQQDDQSGGAQVQIGVVSPVLTVSNPKTIKATKGEVVIIRARSSEAAEMHLHGYDKTLQLKPGKVGQMKLRAKIDGEFEIELHYSGSEAELGTLRVSP